MEHENGDMLKIVRAEAEAHEQAIALDLAQRVRDLRTEQNLTLEQAAQKAGLARSTLSKIENNQMSPTFDAVKKLAIGLGISVPQLFTPPKDSANMARFVSNKAGDGKAIVTETYEHEMLASGLKSKDMLPYRARIRARSFEDFEGWIRHDGQEFLYVLSGVIKLFTEFYEPIEMRRGDSAYYDAAMGHNVISLSDEDSEILWVTSLN